MTNRVILIGRLTRDPELRTTTTGKHVVGFSIAVDRRVKGQDGVEADFFRVSAWGQTAEFVANYLAKGRLVSVDGRLQQRKYTTQDGVEKETVEVVADNVQGLDRPREDEGDHAAKPTKVTGTASPARVAPPADWDPFAEG